VEKRFLGGVGGGVVFWGFGGVGVGGGGAGAGGWGGGFGGVWGGGAGGGGGRVGGRLFFTLRLIGHSMLLVAFLE